MKALEFLLTLEKIRDNSVLGDKEKNSRIMVLVIEELDGAIRDIKKLIKRSDKK